MSVTYGFYNSVNGDRKYDATQISSIFDGIVTDGVFMSIGTSLRVKAASGMTVNVGIGRAWFNHTWTYNDALLPLTLDTSDVLNSRIDSVILEINSGESVRANSIKILKGAPASSPKEPSLTSSVTLHQYRLANILVKAGVSSINQSNITDLIGSSSTPYITGILKTVNTDELMAQWKSDWAVYIETQKSDSSKWVQNFESELSAWKTEFESDNSEWSNTQKTNFEIWLKSLQDELGDNVAANLELKIDNLTYRPNSETTFNSDGTITETSDTVDVKTTFNSDGSITEVYTYPNGIKKTAKTTFSDTGVNVSVE